MTTSLRYDDWGAELSELEDDPDEYEIDESVIEALWRALCECAAETDRRAERAARRT